MYLFYLTDTSHAVDVTLITIRVCTPYNTAYLITLYLLFQHTKWHSYYTLVWLASGMKVLCWLRYLLVDSNGSNSGFGSSANVCWMGDGIGKVNDEFTQLNKSYLMRCPPCASQHGRCGSMACSQGQWLPYCGLASFRLLGVGLGNGGC